MLPPPPPSGHSQLMGNFMGAAQRSAAGNMPEPSARRTWGCRAALTSARQTICRSRCRTLPFSPGLWVCHPLGSAPPQTPSTPGMGPLHRAGGTTREERHIAETWESHRRSDTPQNAGPLGIWAWHSGAEDPCSLLAPRAPRSGATSQAAIPLCPLARIWRAGCARRAHTQQPPCHGSSAQRCLALSPPARSTAWHGGKGAGAAALAADPGRIQAGFPQVPGSG